jgi:hypothetical protein
VIKVWIVYLLVATPAGPRYEALEAWRTKAECQARTAEFVAFAVQQNRRNNVLGATCAESKA